MMRITISDNVIRWGAVGFLLIMISQTGSNDWH